MMCASHRVESDTVIRVRLARANASNPDGWAALADATIRRELPHLPNGLASKLADAGDGMYVVPEPEVLAERARLVVAATGWFPGRRDDFTIALGAEPELAGQLPDWLLNLVLDLGRAGLGAQAVAVADALTRVDPDLQAILDADVAVALAQSGLSDQARARIESNLARWPDDVWVRIHAGDALAVLDDLDGAAVHFDAAVTMAEDADDLDARSSAIQRLRRIRRPHPSDRAPTRQPRRQPHRHSRSQRKPKR
jgi:tetratricopeptide (TPR) repeat protein